MPGAVLNSLYILNFGILIMTYEVGMIIISILHREVSQLIPDHTARKRKSQELKLKHLAPEALSLTVMAYDLPFLISSTPSALHSPIIWFPPLSFRSIP